MPTTPPSPQTVARLDVLRPSSCNVTVAQALDAYHVPVEVIRTLLYEVRSAPNQNQVIAITAWMRLEGQPGYLIVDLLPPCSFQQIYTRDGAALPGVP